MRCISAPVIGALMVLALNSPARAELINWSYTWSSVPDIVEADAPGTGKIYLDHQATGQVEVDTVDPNTDIVATNIRTESTATAASPDRFTNAPFLLSLSISDTQSGELATLQFHGVFNGRLTAQSAQVRPSLDTEDIEQSVTLGHYVYTVTMTSIVPPGPPTSTNKGSIGARATVTVRDLVTAVPEPGTLLSGALGVGLLWLALSRRRPLFSC